MKKYILLTLLLAASASFAGCTDEDATDGNQMLLPEGTLYFNNNRQTVTVDVDVDGSFSAYSPTKDAWCTVSPVNGERKITVTVDDNHSDTARYSYIVVTSPGQKKKIQVSQDCSRYFRLLSSNTLRISSLADSKTITLDTNIDNAAYTVEIPAQDSTWLTADTSGLEITISVTRNTSLERNSTVAISCTAPISKEVFRLSLTIFQLAEGGINIRFAVPDFSESGVYKVMNATVPVAQICKEYLLLDGVIDAQAIVAYPTSSDGTPFLDKGYVAQVLLINDGTTYSAPTSAVHGGVANFNTSTGRLEQYVPNVKPPVANIYIPNGADMTDNIPADMEVVDATLIPEIISDTRADETQTYPVVKIGTQYWMGKNLNTTFYRDHTPIPTNIANTNWKDGKPACCVYGYNDALAAANNRNKTGVLYTWLAINGGFPASNTDLYETDGVNLTDNLAPAGWTVPAAADFDRLIAYIGGAGNMRRLREVTNDRGEFQNISGLPDERISGFAARNGGYRNTSGNYVASTGSNIAYFWSRTIDDTNRAQAYLMNMDNKSAQPAIWACSIRCIKK